MQILHSDSEQEVVFRAAQWENDHFLFTLGGAAVEGAQVSVDATGLVEALSQTSPRLARSLDGASPEALAHMTMTQSGNAILWPQLDVDMSARYLVEVLVGLLATRQRAAARGGSARTAAKRAASRLNGSKGGRPRKKEKEVA